MINHSRWTKAQIYEQSFWERAEKNESDLGWYRWRAEQIEPFVKKYLRDVKELNILEVGSGPVGIISFLNASRKYAVDPLYDFYAKCPNLTKHSKKDVLFIKGKGEKLPFRDSSFNLIIIDNVLDHCQNPKTVMGEISRTLCREDGLIYFAVNLRTKWGVGIRTLLEFFQADKGHPHSFSKADIENLFRNYRIIEENYERERFLPLSSRNIVKFMLGIQETKYTLFASSIHSTHQQYS